MKKPYKSVEEKPMVANELLIDALRYATVAREQKRMIPHEEVYGLLAAKLGWKINHFK